MKKPETPQERRERQAGAKDRIIANAERLRARKIRIDNTGTIPGVPDTTPLNGARIIPTLPDGAIDTLMDEIATELDS